MSEPAFITLNMKSFKLGDLCRLKSGGPAMTVSDTRNDEYVPVEWFDGNAVMRDAFHPLQLVPVDA